MKKLMLISSILFSLLLATQAAACPKEGNYCPNKGEGMNQNAPSFGQYGPFKGSIKYALKHLNLSDGDWNDVKLAFKAYRESLQSMKHGIPIRSLDNGTFNAKLFVKEHPMHRKIAAQAELLETIYLILNNEQKKKFQMLVGAHMQKLQSEGYGMMRCQGGCQTPGKGLQCPNPKMCQGPNCKAPVQMPAKP